MKTCWVVVTYHANAHSNLFNDIQLNIVQSWEAVLEAAKKFKEDYDYEPWSEQFEDPIFGGMEGDESWLVYQRVQMVHIPEGV